MKTPFGGYRKSGSLARDNGAGKTTCFYSVMSSPESCTFSRFISPERSA